MHRCHTQIQPDHTQITACTGTPQMSEKYQICVPTEWFIITLGGDSMGAKDNKVSC